MFANLQSEEHVFVLEFVLPALGLDEPIERGHAYFTFVTPASRTNSVA
jgi:hypothetical protein